MSLRACCGTPSTAWPTSSATPGRVAAGIAWLLGLIHVHAWHPTRCRSLFSGRRRSRNATPGLQVPERAEADRHGARCSCRDRLSLALVALALRRHSPRLRAEATIVEEREALASLRRWPGSSRRASGGGSAAASGRRAASTAYGPPSACDVPTRNWSIGFARRPAAAPGVTVRDHLTAVAAAPATDDRSESATEAAASPSSAAADLAALYELARYSAHAVDAAQAHRFEVLARTFAGRGTQSLSLKSRGRLADWLPVVFSPRLSLYG